MRVNDKAGLRRGNIDTSWNAPCDHAGNSETVVQQLRLLEGFNWDARSVSHLTHFRSNVLRENPVLIEQTLYHETNMRTSDTVRSFTKRSISDCFSSDNSGLASHCNGFKCMRDLQECEEMGKYHEPEFAASRTDNWPPLRKAWCSFATRWITRSGSFRTPCFPHPVRSMNRWQLGGLPASISKRCRLTRGYRSQPPRLREVTGCMGAA